MAALPAFVEHAKTHCRAYRQTLREVCAADINSRAALAALPAVNKSDLIAEQENKPPFGGYDCFGDNTAPPQRLYMSPGPIAECDFPVPDYWRTAAAFHAAGFRSGMLLHNTFSYHFTPAGLMCDEGARTLGGRVFPAGPGNSEQQARAMARLRPQCYSGTPDFLQTILQRADEAGLDVSSLTLATATGGYLSEELRRAYAARGISMLQWYGTADVGCIAFESIAGEPMIVSEGLLVEVVDPLTRLPCATGKKGEVLITNFNTSYPLIRFSLGDLSAVADGVSSCGRTNMRLTGWLGRCDAAVKVRGMFIHPVQIERLLSVCTALDRAQLVVSAEADGRDKLTLRCVLKNGVHADDALITEIIGLLEKETKLRGEVALEDPAEGGLIVDRRQ